jgi:hypothetical protein
VRVCFHCHQSIFILLFARHSKQVAGIAQIGIDFGEGVDNRFQRFLFLAQILCSFLVVPDVGVFQLGVDLF